MAHPSRHWPTCAESTLCCSSLISPGHLLTSHFLLKTLHSFWPHPHPLGLSPVQLLLQRAGQAALGWPSPGLHARPFPSRLQTLCGNRPPPGRSLCSHGRDAMSASASTSDSSAASSPRFSGCLWISHVTSNTKEDPRSHTLIQNSVVSSSSGDNAFQRHGHCISGVPFGSPRSKSVVTEPETV